MSLIPTKGVNVMKQALLVGNGVTSQLIHAYNDNEMMAKLDAVAPHLISIIDGKFNVFREVCKNDDLDKERIIELIKNTPLFAHTSATQVYQKYFEDCGLKYVLGKERLSGIENLLKVVKLFEMPIQSDLIEMANVICFNEGRNGWDAIEADIQKEAFSGFINSFKYIFTTNYDYLLDDIYQKEVFHLHGGFNYIQQKKECGAVSITRNIQDRKGCNPFLAWGIDGYDKRNHVQGGIEYPISYPEEGLEYGHSVIDDYFYEMEFGQYEEIHIWGFSGQNDKHINDCIKQNPNIKRVYYYCNPVTELNNVDFKTYVESMFCAMEKELYLDSWDSIWQKAGRL